MLVDMNGVIYSLSFALDCIEAEFVGISRDHAQWVAFLSTVIGKEYGLSHDELSDLSACAALHDSALTQYIAEEQSGSDIIGAHCTLGEENIRSFPFHKSVDGFILYHHENVNGTGPFGLKEKDIPLQAHIIHLADMIDAACRFPNISRENYAKICKYIGSERTRMFSCELADAFFAAMPEDKYLSLAGRTAGELIFEQLPHTEEEHSFDAVKAAMDTFGRIVDYKSPFTRRHSEEIAKKVLRMAGEYGYPREHAQRLYVAGALHDIGKMAVKNDILEKPGRLNDDEFSRMREHARYTYDMLSRISGFSDITAWASHHHEKLNGQGYPFGKTAEELSEEERLLSCIDIYQALSEDRPYKPGMSHADCMAIMREMVKKGYIDGRITEDICRVFA